MRHIHLSRGHRNLRPYNWLAYNHNDRFLERVSPLLKGVLFDFGAGESPYRSFFMRHVDEYFAVDWAGSIHDTEPDIIADLNKPLPLEPGIADTIVSFSVLEHLREPDTMLGEAARLLNSGGYLILQVPWQWRIHEAPYDYFRYTPNGLRYLLEKANFEEVQIEPQGGFFTMMALKFNYFTTRMIRGPALVRALIWSALCAIWYISQYLALLLDRFDGNRAAETIGYCVTARKQ